MQMNVIATLLKFPVVVWESPHNITKLIVIRVSDVVVSLVAMNLMSSIQESKKQSVGVYC